MLDPEKIHLLREALEEAGQENEYLHLTTVLKANQLYASVKELLVNFSQVLDEVEGQ